ncbi:hypothetical protein Hanom_Chr02g00144671 [Helianthus anomalus]
MGGTILLFLLGVKSLKAPEEHISLVMPNSSNIGVMVCFKRDSLLPSFVNNSKGECLSLIKRSLRSGSRNSRGPKVTGKNMCQGLTTRLTYCVLFHMVRNIFAMLFKG